MLQRFVTSDNNYESSEMATWVLPVVGLASSVFFWAVAELAHLNKYHLHKLKFINIHVHISWKLIGMITNTE